MSITTPSSEKVAPAVPLPVELRDYFAAKALGIMCSSNVKETGTFSSPEGRATVARVCYAMADAMLEARSKA